MRAEDLCECQRHRCRVPTTGDRRLAMHIRELEMGGGLSALPDGAVLSSSGGYLPTCKLHPVTPHTVKDCVHALSQVGPHAVNLAGGQAASMRISRDIMQRLHADTAEAAPLTAKAKTEEYIQQMKGLLWL